MSLITIHGRNRSGKSTTAKLLARMLGYQHFSTGDLAREIAKERRISIEQLMILAKEDETIDFSIDAALKEKGEQGKWVIDCRMGYYFFPESFKVYLNLDPYIAAERHYRDIKDTEDNTLHSVDEVNLVLLERFEVDKERYLKLYNTDFTDMNHYDLVIDTGLTDNYPQKVAKDISSAFSEWKEAKMRV